MILQKAIRARGTDAQQAPLRAMDAVLLRMLVDWFSVGFLDLQRISWNSPAAYLEQVCDGSTVLWIAGYLEQVRAMLSMHTAPRFLCPILNSSSKGR
jgi:hypothetical protein